MHFSIWAKGSRISTEGESRRASVGMVVKESGGRRKGDSGSEGDGVVEVVMMVEKVVQWW